MVAVSSVSTSSSLSSSSSFSKIIIGALVLGLILVATFSLPLSTFHPNLNVLSNDSHDSNSNDIAKKDGGDVTVTVIPLVSGQRSSSTFLAYKIMDPMPCHLSLNEIMYKDEAQSGDAWTKEAVTMGFSHVKFAHWLDNPEPLADFIVQVAKRRCREKFAETPSHNQCNNHCYVNYKHFPDHMAPWQHQLVWALLLEKTDVSFVVLERDVSERWRSTWYAENTGDWNVWADGDHKKKLETAQIPPMDKQFWKEHTEWYKMVRGFTGLINRRRERRHEPLMPVVELEYSSIVKQPVEYTQAMIREQIMNRNNGNNGLENPGSSTQLLG